MKKTLICVCAAALLAGCGSSTGYKIKGEMKGMPDQKVFITTNPHKGEKTDTAEMKNGEFIFAKKEVYPNMAYIVFENDKNVIPVLLEPGQIKVNGQLDSLFTYTVSGTESNDILDSYRKSYNEINKNYYELANQRMALKPEDSLMTEELEIKIDSLVKKLDNLSKDIVKNNPKTFAAAYLVSQTQTYGFTPQQMDSMINLVQGLPKNSFTDNMIERRDILTNVAVGRPALNFTLKNLEGKDFSLDSLRGKVVVLDFWASWCGPCRNENPEMVKIYDKYKDKDFTIVSISLDDNVENWKKAVSEDKLTWTQVIDNMSDVAKSTADLYGVVAIPHTVVIDKNGNIAANVIFGQQLDAKIQSLIQ